MQATPQTSQTNKKSHKPTPKTAKVFMNGRSQAVRLPAQFRFDTDEVYIRQDDKTGDVILSKRPNDWDEFFEALDELKASGELDMYDDDETLFPRDNRPQERQLFDDWAE